MTLRVLPIAVRDLDEIRRWLEREHPTRLDRVMNDLFTGLAQLERLPSSGPLAKDPVLAQRGYRTPVRGRHVVFFKLSGKTVIVYRVLHHKRSWRHLI